MKAEIEQRVTKLYYFQEVMRLSYSDAVEAYEAFGKHDESTMYGIALGYLAMAQQSHLELKRIYWESDLSHYEIESYFTAFEDYAFQFKQVITEKDRNISWLVGTREKLIECWKSTDEFIRNWINDNIPKRS
ncbi:hypothetical protein J2TS6_48980 [Paenibacillus albilobatus]|uniref:Uncharacterized protein n=1 Tax=Paenibacillus albilobatus TaxID=2716884 RepID=A0A919XN78_9BACL|nr:hypothetical protein [Paenibacillus albilobatus]GIO33757.1 hypothetical protein J2TS6_48980 [Paenibacillus albilobatus]